MQATRIITDLKNPRKFAFAEGDSSHPRSIISRHLALRAIIIHVDENFVFIVCFVVNYFFHHRGHKVPCILTPDHDVTFLAVYTSSIHKKS